MCHILLSQHGEEPVALSWGREVPLPGVEMISVPTSTLRALSWRR